MELDGLETLRNMMNEMDKLVHRSMLLRDILQYYNPETMTFDIPEKWKNNRILPDKLPAESPRHMLHNKITKLLSYNELIEMGIH